jgi:hypothetical protein
MMAKWAIEVRSVSSAGATSREGGADEHNVYHNAYTSVFLLEQQLTDLSL